MIGNIYVDDNRPIFMRCWGCQMWGTPVPGNYDTCGNCGSSDVTMYYPGKPPRKYIWNLWTYDGDTQTFIHTEVER